jgi:hypothetical protein
MVSLFFVKLLEIPAWIAIGMGICAVRWWIGLIASPILSVLWLGLLAMWRTTPINAPLTQWLVAAAATFVAFSIGRFIRGLRPPKPLQD